ncbi:MAG: alpha/beta hydrolase [Gemmatimonadetes bacterium]|nr:alpha/beta hydrolase [Gemmatimonadota bacterium]
MLSPLSESGAQAGKAQGAPSAEGWYLPTADSAGELFVFEKGGHSTTPVVVLHGGPGADFDYMLPIATGLEREFRFVFYDQRGSLRSRVTPDSISMGKHVADLEQLRRALGVERLHLVSHSAGTLLAFEYLKSFPHRVANIVLVGALPHKNGRAHFDKEYATLWRGLADSADAFAKREAVQREIRLAGLDRDALTPKERSQLAQIRQVGAERLRVDRWRETMPIRVSPDAARRTRETTEFEYDVGPLLARLEFPVTVINGEFDYTVGPRNSPLWRRLAETVARNVRVVVIRDASHNVWYDNPDEFRAALRRALRPR